MWRQSGQAWVRLHPLIFFRQCGSQVCAVRPLDFWQPGYWGGYCGVTDYIVPILLLLAAVLALWKKENAYDFQKRLLTVHTPDLRDFSRTQKADEYQFPEKVAISVAADAGTVTRTAAEDFADFLNTSMSITAEITTDAAPVQIALAKDTGIDLGEFAAYKGFRIDVTADSPGLLMLAIRIYPKSELLPHRQDFALVKWL